MTTTNHMELVRENRKVEFCYLDEGLNGNYDADDPDDVALLRFDIYEMVDGEWQAMDDGSYCTQMPVDTDAEIIQQALALIMENTYDLANVKKAGEALSWVSPDWFVKPSNNQGE